ncbi:MAG: hypothetical protein RL839_08690 [Gammaproteobacteria bacterium]
MRLSGSPQQTINAGAPVSTVALLGTDFPGVALRSSVEPDQRVMLGDPGALPGGVYPGIG